MIYDPAHPVKPIRISQVSNFGAKPIFIMTDELINLTCFALNQFKE